MHVIRVIRRQPVLVSIPVEGAVYCVNGERVSTSAKASCVVGGREAVSNLRWLIDGPPAGPDSGPGAAGGITPVLQFEAARVA